MGQYLRADKAIGGYYRLRHPGYIHVLCIMYMKSFYRYFYLEIFTHYLQFIHNLFIFKLYTWDIQRREICNEHHYTHR